MSMEAANTHGARSTINVTPLIDVLLVLLIIFMVLPAWPECKSRQVYQKPFPQRLFFDRTHHCDLAATCRA